MNIKDFKAGQLVKRQDYYSFEPEPVNHYWIWNEPEINVKLEKANKLLGELNAFTTMVPDVDLFIAMHIKKEATKSSKIEGTKTELDEALLPIEDIIPEKRDDWKEVQNYINAINWAIEELKNLPLSNRLIKHTHKLLLEGTRGERKTPGEFRRSQNWIGGHSPSDAVFVPPHDSNLPDMLSDFEKFLNNDLINVPHLIKIAISHYQFETIHPFLDGNGRIGRLLITLYLVSNKIISKPSLYLSDYFEKNRAMYYDHLTLVRKKNDLAGWINFFLKAVIITAENGISTFKQILELKQKYDVFISQSGRRADMIRQTINHLYKNPITDTKVLSEVINKDRRTGGRILKTLEDEKIVREFTGNKRNKNYVMHDYLNIFMKD